ncbi:Hypothetical predicted protein [Mytilus galloprovincialis]|uniref:Uncharacterized protein n=1 Tax=Mytilus galloprovincialis TaxID=29158 RepID=A0A8B6EPG6_MYTGA|nr:Hypothetical predicted protein [Mytilus galloprovincialis]
MVLLKISYLVIQWIWVISTTQSTLARCETQTCMVCCHTINSVNINGTNNEINHNHDCICCPISYEVSTQKLTNESDGWKYGYLQDCKSDEWTYGYLQECESPSNYTDRNDITWIYGYLNGFNYSTNESSKQILDNCLFEDCWSNQLNTSVDATAFVTTDDDDGWIYTYSNFSSYECLSQCNISLNCSKHSCGYCVGCCTLIQCCECDKVDTTPESSTTEDFSTILTTEQSIASTSSSITTERSTVTHSEPTSTETSIQTTQTPIPATKTTSTITQTTTDQSTTETAPKETTTVTPSEPSITETTTDQSTLETSPTETTTVTHSVPTSTETSIPSTQTTLSTTQTTTDQSTTETLPTETTTVTHSVPTSTETTVQTTETSIPSTQTTLSTTQTTTDQSTTETSQIETTTVTPSEPSTTETSVGTTITSIQTTETTITATQTTTDQSTTETSPKETTTFTTSQTTMTDIASSTAMETTTSTMPTKPTDRSNCLHFACSCCCCPCAIDNHTFETDYNKDKPEGYIYNQVCCKRTKQNATNDDDDWVYGYTNQSLCQINGTIDGDLDLLKYGYISAKNCSSFSCISCCNKGTNSYEMNSTFDSSCLFCSNVCNCCGYSNSTDDKMVSVNWSHRMLFIMLFSL